MKDMMYKMACEFFNMLFHLKPKESKEFNTHYDFALYLIEKVQAANDYEEEKLLELAISELKEAAKVVEKMYPEEEQK